MRLLSELTIGLVETMEEMWRVSSPAFVMSTVVSLKDSISTSPKFRFLNEIDIRATAFQMRVWDYLQSIPYGQTRSYGEVAEGIGQPTAVRAVASA